MGKVVEVRRGYLTCLHREYIVSYFHIIQAQKGFSQNHGIYRVLEK